MAADSWYMGDVSAPSSGPPLHLPRGEAAQVEDSPLECRAAVTGSPRAFFEQCTTAVMAAVGPIVSSAVQAACKASAPSALEPLFAVLKVRDESIAVLKAELDEYKRICPQLAARLARLEDALPTPRDADPSSPPRSRARWRRAVATRYRMYFSLNHDLYAQYKAEVSDENELRPWARQHLDACAEQEYRPRPRARHSDVESYESLSSMEQLLCPMCERPLRSDNTCECGFDSYSMDDDHPNASSEDL